MTNALPTAESARQWLERLAVSLWVRVPDDDAAWHVAESWACRVEDQVMDELVDAAEPAIVPVPAEMIGAEGVEPYPVPSVTRLLHGWTPRGSVTSRELTREHSIVREVRRMRHPLAGSVTWHLSAAVDVQLAYAVDPVPSNPDEQLEERQVRLNCSLRGLTHAARQALSDVAARFADEHDLMYGQVGRPLSSGADTILESHLPMARGPHQAWRRDALRGYDWVTLVRPALWARLGEDHRGYARGHLFAVEELPRGLVRLQATSRPEDYDAVALRRVFESLSPLLPQQSPEPHPFFMPGDPPPPPMLVFEAPHHLP